MSDSSGLTSTALPSRYSFALVCCCSYINSTRVSLLLPCQQPRVAVGQRRGVGERAGGQAARFCHLILERPELRLLALVLALLPPVLELLLLLLLLLLGKPHLLDVLEVGRVPRLLGQEGERPARSAVQQRTGSAPTRFCRANDALSGRAGVEAIARMFARDAGVRRGTRRPRVARRRLRGPRGNSLLRVARSVWRAAPVAR